MIIITRYQNNQAVLQEILDDKMPDGRNRWESIKEYSPIMRGFGGYERVTKNKIVSVSPDKTIKTIYIRK